jgi:Mg-chelatase subunit ChlD
VKQTIKRWTVIGLILTILGGGLSADDRDEPVDILVALDKSLSMEEEIEAVKQYVSTHIVENLLQNGDFFLITAFYGEANVIVSDFIKGEDHKEQVESIISSIEADGRFTDIGNALDSLKDQVAKYSTPGRKKTLLLITDGKHEPPPGSKYYSKDGSYSHEYLEGMTSETQKEGWKIIVIGLGDDSARDLAEALDAEYVETVESPSATELDAMIPDLTGVIRVVGDPRFSAVNRKNRADLTLALETRLFSEPPVIKIRSIALTADGHAEDNILAEPVERELLKEGETKLTMPLQLDGTLPPGSYEGTLVFGFAGPERFPRELAVSFRVKSFLQNAPWVIPVGIAALALLGLLLFFLFRLIGKGRKVNFRMIVEEKPLKKGKDTFTARTGKPLYLKESLDVFDIGDKKTTNAIAVLNLGDSGLSLKALKEDRFPELKSSPRNVLGSAYLIRSESGKDYHVKFVNV